MKRLEDLPGEVLLCIFQQLVNGTATPDGIFNYFEWEARARAKNNTARPLGLSTSHDSGLGLDIFDFVCEPQNRLPKAWMVRSEADDVVDLVADSDDDFSFDFARPLSSTLGTKRYAHPLLAIRATSRYMRSAVESYCNTCMLTIHRIAKAVNKIDFRPDTPGVPRSTQLIEFMWTRCGFCHRSCNREGLFAWFLRVCEYCEEYHFPSIPEAEAVERYHLKSDVLRDYLHRGRIRAYRDSQNKLHYLEESVMALSILLNGRDRILLQQQERAFQKKLERQAWIDAVRLGLKMNGVNPDVFSGIEHEDIPLEEYDRKLHTPNFKGETVDEFVRFQVLVHLIKTKTKFHSDILPLLNKLDYLLNGGSINEVIRAPRIRTYNTTFFTNKISPDLKFESGYLMVDIMDIALFSLFIVEFNIRNVSSAKRVIKAYLKCAERWTMGFWKGDFQMRGGFTDGPWSIQRYPLWFQTTQSIYESAPTPPPETMSEMMLSEEGTIVTVNVGTEQDTQTTTAQAIVERRAEMSRYLGGNIERLLDTRRFKPKLERTLAYGMFPTS